MIKTPNLKIYYLSTCAFAVGGSVMAVEMTAARVLAPHFGASMFVWTALIVTVLLSMSVGYWVGGIVASRIQKFDALGLFMVGSAILLMGGMWSVQGLFGRIPTLFGLIDVASVALFVGALLATFIVFSAPVFMMAMAGPVILKLWAANNNQDVGQSSGRYFAISTAGSVLGTLAPSLFLVPEFGVRLTMIFIAILLASLGLPLLRGSIRLLMGLLVLFLILFVFQQGQEISSSVIYQNESSYQHIKVLTDNDGRRYLVFNEASGIQSVYYPAEQRTGKYYDHFVALPAMINSNDQQIDTAILGLAGGTLVRQFMAGLPENTTATFKGVELDPEVINVANEFFALEELPIEVINNDGRMFLANNDETYDVIIIDAYGTQMYIPPHMTTTEFFSLVSSRLNAGGIVAMNVNAPTRDSRLLKAILNSIGLAFPNVYISKAGSSWNWLIVASRSEIVYEDVAQLIPAEYADIAEALLLAERYEFDFTAEVLRDDRAPIEFMTDEMILESRWSD